MSEIDGSTNHIGGWDGGHCPSISVDSGTIGEWQDGIYTYIENYEPYSYGSYVTNGNQHEERNYFDIT